MRKSTNATIRFESPVGLPLEAAFDAGRLTSDGGLPWLAEADAALGLCEALAAMHPRVAARVRCVTAWRRWCGSGCTRSRADTRTRTTPTRCGPIRC